MPRALSSSTLIYFQLVFVLTTLLVVVHGSPITFTTHTATGHTDRHAMRRAITDNQTTTINPLTSSSTPSSPSSQTISDGGGTGFSPVSILWITFSILLTPLSLVGVRLYRITSGIAIGLSLSLLLWAAFVNSTTSGTSLAGTPNTSDLYLTLFIFGCFALGFLFGSWLRIGILVGVSLLGANAGVALGIMLALLRPGLLIPIYAVNIIPLALLGVAGALWPLWHQRLAVIVSSSACGCFFLALSIDLILHQQSGISAGLRFLLDRNKNHLSTTLQIGYHPSLSTIIILGVCILLVPLFSFAQHKIWKGPFDRSTDSMEEWNRKVNGAPILGPGDDGYISDEKEEDAKPQHTKLRFPSIVPSLPGNLPPSMNAQGGQGNKVVSPIYLAQQAAFQQNPPMPMQTTPGPGIGRLAFVGYWGSGVGNAVGTVAKRVSKRFSGFGARADKRMSAMSAPSIYSVDQGNPGAGAGGGQKGWGWRPQRFSRQPQQSSQLQVPGQNQGRQPASLREYMSTRDEAPGSVYGGVQVQQTKPLRLPERTAAAAAAAAPVNRGVPPSAYVPPSNWGSQPQLPSQSQPTRNRPQAQPIQQSLPQLQAQRSAPAPSLRTGRWDDYRQGGGGGSSIKTTTTSSTGGRTPTSARAPPITPQSARMPVTPQSARTPTSSRPQNPARTQMPSSSQGQGNRNKLKTATRYNLL